MSDSATIKSARERIGESQEEFAKRFGVDQSTIHRWETEGVPTQGSARKVIELVLGSLPDAPAPQVSP